MKNVILACLAALMVFAVGCESSKDAGNVTLATRTDSVSYAIGMDIGKNFAMQKIEVDPDILIKGFKDANDSGSAAMLTDDQVRAVIMSFQMELQKKQQEERMAQAAGALQRANDFLAGNKNNPGVTELPSGLQYQVIKEGNGASPTIDDQVTTHYKGTLTDGTVFDSSYDRGQPATFALKGVIRAWQEILPMMKEGATYRIWSPPGLAYGEMGSPPKIGPNEALVFDIELIKVVK